MKKKTSLKKNQVNHYDCHEVVLKISTRLSKEELLNSLNVNWLDIVNDPTCRISEWTRPIERIGIEEVTYESEQETSTEKIS